MRTVLVIVAIAVLWFQAAANTGAATAQASSSPVRIVFVPEEPQFAEAAREYERLWAAEGPRIIAAMERVSGLRFAAPAYADTAITANVLERPSNSGYRERPMTLRASYPPDTKKATLIHELGHRLQSNLFRQADEEHPQLFLWLYDTWVALYGQPFADEQVAVERARRGPYPAAWDSALGLSAAERASRWKAIVAGSRR